MDELDIQIINLLKINSRAPFVNISKKLNVSEGTIRSRVQTMVDKGIIQQFTIKTSNKNVKAMIDIKLKVNANADIVAERIMNIDGVERVFEVSGDLDIVTVVDVTSTKDLTEIIDAIRGFSDIISTQTNLILKEF